MATNSRTSGGRLAENPGISATLERNDPGRSLAEQLAALDQVARDRILASLTDEQVESILYDWHVWARPNQVAPDGDWQTWLVLAGRGYGKTRVGAEWVRANVCGSTPLAAGKYRRFALVAETAADARDVLVEGESGILGVHPPDFKPLYEVTKRRLTWPNGAIATLYNATEPDQLRGPQHDAAWCDELAKWRYVEQTWDQLQFGLRIGNDPRQVITTTPRPLPVLRTIMADPSTVVTKGSTYENRSNLAPKFFAQVIRRYEGTRLGRQELQAEILDDMPGALWRRKEIEEFRVQRAPEDLRRVVVGVDPPAGGATDDGAAEAGIVAAGIDEATGHIYVLDDQSLAGTPDGWARRAVSTYRVHDADRIVAEVNQGGDMVESTIRTVDVDVPITKVHASRGKIARAEPVAALYEQGRVHHVGRFAALEDQMCTLDPNTGLAGGVSPDRVDALVWACHDLLGLVKRATKSARREGRRGLTKSDHGGFNPHAW